MKIKEIFFEIDGKKYSIRISDGLNKGFILSEIDKDINDQPLEQTYNISIKEWTFKDTLDELKLDWQLIKFKFIDWLRSRKRLGYRQSVETTTIPKLDVIIKDENGNTKHCKKDNSTNQN